MRQWQKNCRTQLDISDHQKSGSVPIRGRQIDRWLLAGTLTVREVKILSVGGWQTPAGVKQVGEPHRRCVLPLWNAGPGVCSAVTIQCDTYPVQHVSDATLVRCNTYPTQHLSNATLIRRNTCPMQHSSNAAVHTRYCSKNQCWIQGRHLYLDSECPNTWICGTSGRFRPFACWICFLSPVAPSGKTILSNNWSPMQLIVKLQSWANHPQLCLLAM
jgi:hypothetical protein